MILSSGFPDVTGGPRDLLHKVLWRFPWRFLEEEADELAPGSLHLPAGPGFPAGGTSPNQSKPCSTPIPTRTLHAH